MPDGWGDEAEETDGDGGWQPWQWWGSLVFSTENWLPPTKPPTLTDREWQAVCLWHRPSRPPHVRGWTGIASELGVTKGTARALVERAARKLAGVDPRSERNDPRAKPWRAAVLDRAGHACRCCGATDRLHAHHIKSFANHPKRRWDVRNGVTLCRLCHGSAHHGELNEALVGGRRGAGGAGNTGVVAGTGRGAADAADTRPPGDLGPAMRPTFRAVPAIVVARGRRPPARKGPAAAAAMATP